MKTVKYYVDEKGADRNDRGSLKTSVDKNKKANAQEVCI